MRIDKLPRKELEPFSTQELDEKFKEAVLKGYNIFLTGPAGTGKSYNIKKLELLRKCGLKVAYTASTGISALNIGGETIHRFSGLGISNKISDIEQIKKNRYKWDKIQDKLWDLNLLVIDEVSMIRSDVFDTLNELFKEARECDDPFGGVQVVLVGDLFQLPPVVKTQERNRVGNEWVFASSAWKELDLETVKLTKVYRQTDEDFIKGLGLIRIGRVSTEVDQMIGRCEDRELEILPTYLRSTNEEVDYINFKYMSEIDSEEAFYPTIITGATSYREEQLFKDLGRRGVSLKVGCRIMTTFNHPLDLYVNGSRGWVRELKENEVLVEFDNGSIHNVSYNKREIKDEKGRVKETISEMPIRLGWAITIHKSQGMTIDTLEIDFNNIFAPSQAYVALSRAKDLSGLRVKNWNRRKVFVDNRVTSFYFR